MTQSITRLPCGCFFKGRIFYRECLEHKKPTDWKKVNESLSYHAISATPQLTIR